MHDEIANKEIREREQTEYRDHGIFLEWTSEDVLRKQLDESKTELKKKMIKSRILAHEQLLTGKTESFRQQFTSRQTISKDAEDPSVFATTAELLADKLSICIGEREDSTIIVYGHEKSGKSRTTDCVISALITKNTSAINTACIQHMMKLEHERKQRDRQQAMLLAEAEQTAAEAIKRDNVISTGQAIQAARSLSKDQRKSKVSIVAEDAPFTPKRKKTVGRLSVAGGSSFANSGKRVSLIKRQSISAESTTRLGKILPPPPLEKVDFTQLRTQNGTQETDFQKTGFADEELESLAPSVRVQQVTSISSGKEKSQPNLKARVSLAAKRISLACSPLPPLTRKSSAMTSVTNNGRRGHSDFLTFDGKTTNIKVTPLPGFPDWVKKSEVSMWLCTSEVGAMTLLFIGDKKTSVATFKIALNTNERMEPDKGTTTFFLRDNSSNTLCATSHEELCDGKWHFIVFSITDPLENILKFRVDGKSCRLSIKVSEGPHNFSGWDQIIAIGAEVAGLGSSGAVSTRMERFFDGSMADVRFWEIDNSEQYSLRSQWPLIRCSDPASAPDSLSASDGVIVSPLWERMEFPDTCLYLNGLYSHINAGTLGDFGISLGLTKVEFWMRSSVLDEPMCVFGVTDSQMKQPCLVIEFNRNPLGKFQRGVLVVTLRDCYGKELIAFCPSGGITDGQWHQVTVDVNCNENRIGIKVDSNALDTVEYYKSETPTAFAPLSQYVCVGAHNFRGTLQSHYEGFIKEFKVFTHAFAGQYSCIVHWGIDEGAGAVLAMDRTGNGNSGIIYDRPTKKKASKSSTWLVIDQPDQLLGCSSSPESGDPNNWQQLKEVRNYSNNEVLTAYLSISQTTSESGLQVEHIQDLYTGDEINLSPETETLISAYGRPADQEVPWLQIRTLPTHIYKPVSNAAELQTGITRAMDSIQLLDDQGTRILIIKIGDCRCTIIDLLGFSQKTRSIWDSTVKEWVEPVALMTADDKKTTYLNKKVLQTEKLLMNIGYNPSMLRRAKPDFKKLGFIDTNTGEILMESLLSKPESNIFFIRMQRQETIHEKECTAMFLENLRESTRIFSSVIIQKAIRMKLAKNKCKKLYSQRQLVNQQVDQVKHLRDAYPQHTCIRENKYLLIICTGNPESSLLPKIPDIEQQANDMRDLYTEQQWAVELLINSDCTVSNINEKITEYKSKAESGNFIMVHYLGYVADSVYHKFLSCDELCDMVSKHEQDARSSTESEETLSRKIIKQEEVTEVEESLSAQNEREAADKELRKEQRKKEMELRRQSANNEKKPSSGWVTSTRVDYNAPQKQRSSLDSDAARKAREEERRAKTPIPFAPSPTPDLGFEPIDLPWSSDKEVFLVLNDATHRYLPPGTVTFKSFHDTLITPRLGYHCIVTIAAYPAPYTDTVPFAFFSASSGVQHRWEGIPAPCFLNYYLKKAASGNGTQNIKDLPKSKERIEKDEETLKVWKQHCELAVDGRPKPIKRISEMGVDLIGFQEYLLSQMRKRNIELIHSSKGTYVGDMVVADYNMDTLRNIPTRRRRKDKRGGALITVSLDQTQLTSIKTVLEEQITTLQTSKQFQGDTIKGWTLSRMVSLENSSGPTELYIDFNDADANMFLPPYTSDTIWNHYLNLITGGHASSVHYEVETVSGKKRHFRIKLLITSNVSDVVEEICTRVRGSFDISFPKHSLTKEITPFRISKSTSFVFVSSNRAVMKAFKLFMSGDLSDILPCPVYSVTILSDKQLSEMDELRKTEIHEAKKKEQRTREENLSEDEKRRRAVAATRKSLREESS